jgi:signal transduction histidine kinase
LASAAQPPGSPVVEWSHEVQFRRLAPPLETALFRIIQEGLNNACRHSRSERVQVRLFQQGDRLRLEVIDWGKGFEPERVDENRFGLAGIRERATLFGGELTIETGPGKGTRITVELPVVEAEEGENDA